MQLMTRKCQIFGTGWTKRTKIFIKEKKPKAGRDVNVKVEKLGYEQEESSES